MIFDDFNHVARRHVRPRSSRCARAANIAALLMIGAAASFGRAALAADIPEIGIDAAGPTEALPLGSAFYLTGKAPADLTKVEPSFVRYSFPAFGLHSASPFTSCADVARALGPRRDNSKQGLVGVHEIWASPVVPDKKDVQPDSPTSEDVHRYKEQFGNYGGLHPAFVLAPWKRAADQTGETTFKVLVPADAFFRTGARYCLFVYETHHVVKDDKTGIPNLLIKYAQDYAACNENDKACISQQNDKLFANIDTALKAVSASNRAKLKTAITELIDNKLANDVRRIMAASRDPRLLAMAPSANPNFKPFDPIDATEHTPSGLVGSDMGGFLAEVIARAGDLRVLPKSAQAPKTGGAAGHPPASTLEYFTSDGALQIGRIAVLEGFHGFRFTTEPPTSKKGDEQRLKTSLDSYTLPGSSVTLLDVLELSRGRVRVGKTFIAFAELPERLKGVLGFPEGGIAPSTSDDLKSLTAQMYSLRKVIDDALNASGEEPRDIPAKSVYRPLGNWLRAVFAFCTPKTATTCAADQNPLDQLDDLLRGYTTAVATWNASPAALTLHTEQDQQTLTYSLESQYAFTQQSWFFSYVTPFFGYAHVAGPSLPFDVATVGVQVFPYPNSFNEPMWSNGKIDWLRVLALELGAGLKTTGLGFEGRYSGPIDGVPPLFTGLAAQFIPYVTVSGGVAWLGLRSSALPQEAPHLYLSCYLSLSVQANVPDLIKTLIAGGTPGASTGAK